MGADSKIGWTHHTFNPWWGCVEVSPECDRCYARSFSKRTGNEVWGPHAPRRFFGDKHWAEPLKWNAAAVKAGERHRVFCASMADVFEHRSDDVGIEMAKERKRLFRLIEETPQLDWLLLTKRPQNIGRFAPTSWMSQPRHNVWFGTTAGTQRSWETHVPRLMRVPAAVRFVSAEPLLARVTVDLTDPALRDADGRMVDWVIVGSESGGRARPMNPSWAAQLLDECRLHGVPFFTKQIVTPTGRLHGVRKGEDPRWWPNNIHWLRQFPKVNT